MNLWLVGMMGSGKSEVGRLVATQLGMKFVDTDAAISDRQGRTVRQIWTDEGEERFRDLESSMILQIAAVAAPQVIATGGGSVIRSANRDAMRTSGRVIWLHAPADVLAARLKQDEERPLLNGAMDLKDQISRLLASRESTYDDLADARVDAGSGDSVTVAAMVEESWNRFQLG